MLRYGWWLALFLVLLAGCGKPEDSPYELELDKHGKSEAREYIVGIHPLHNPQRLMNVYGPIIEYIDSHIPEARFKLEASRNYEEFDKKLDEGHFDFAMPNPYQTVRSLKHGYRVFGKMGDDQDFKGIILIRKDSHINEVSDLKGKAVAYPSASALAATMMPQYYLHTHGIDINKEIENRYVGSQESSILNVLRGHVAAGATWPVPWKTFSAEHPDWANQLEVKWQTDTLQNNGWVVRKDVPQPLAEKFKTLLIGLSDSEQGRQMLAKLPVSRFEVADDATYKPVIDFLTIFSAQVRPVAW